MNNAINALLNTFLVSIPEESFIVILTLVFLKRYDMLDLRMWKQNLKWIMIPTIPVAILINIFRYIIILEQPIMSLICPLLMGILIVYIVLKNSYDDAKKKLIIKALIFTFLGFVIIGLIELLYIPILLSLLHKSISYFNNNIMYNFLLAIPGRIMEICIIVFIIIRKNNSIQINLFNTIVKNKFFTSSFLVIIISTVLMIIYMAKLLTIDNILTNLKITDQLIIVVMIASIPTILITWFLMFVNYILTQEKRIQQTYENLALRDNIMTDVDNK